MYEDFLPLVVKPARYIDQEINAVRKDLAKVRTKVCLFFPDTYEVGMSHLGLRILYHILNGRDDTACERVFSPWTDYEERLRAAGRPLTSLESNLPLSRFDIIGVTLQYELSYTNILAAFDLAGVPRRSRNREDGHPVVIAGGPCAVNPGPLSDFIDAFFIGEAEEAAHEIVELRQEHPSREKYLDALSKRDGFFVPALGNKPVVRRFLKNLEAAPYPDRPLVPLMKPVHDRIAVEVARGCIRGCRFCQAGVIYRPYRERSEHTIARLLDESLRCTGYEELSLASLSCGDYSGIGRLVPQLMQKYRDGRVSLSLPSLRVGTLTPEMIEAIGATRKTGFTLAPEAGTERLRRVINKPVSDLDLLDAAETIFRNGWNVLKLYFMIGLPTETDEDLEGIIRLCRDLLSLGKRVARRPVQLNVSVSTFVPKPHTAFQWLGQETPGEVRRKQAYLSSGLRRRGIHLKPHSVDMSLLEAVFARGDRSIGAVIESAVGLGCRFDGWHEKFDISKWNEAFSQCGLDATGLACRSLDPAEDLPWDHVRTGVTRDFLLREYRRAFAAEVSENCRVSCERCGIRCADGGSELVGRAASEPERETAKSTPLPTTASGAMERVRVRMKYSRTGRVRFLSHLDFMTLFFRSVARAQVPVAFSRGFNPHPQIAFGPALPVGMESGAEYLDLEMEPVSDLLPVVKDLNNALPEGIRILDARVIPAKAPSLSASISRYVYEAAVLPQHTSDMEAKINELLARSSILITKEGAEKDIRPGVDSIRMKDSDLLEVILQDLERVKPRVHDVIEQLFSVPRDQALLFGIRRTAQFWNDRGTWASPLDVK